eukprot:ANDGO_02586.mRNA.1 Uridine-cytidine kinase B
MSIVHDNTASSVRHPFIIGVAGGTASGKTTVCRKIEQQLGAKRVVMLSMDSFYRNLTEEEKANVVSHDFDHPNAFEFDLLVQTLRCLSRGESVDIPVYNFVMHAREQDKKIRIEAGSADVVVVEGILTFFSEELRNCFDMKIYVHTDADERLIRRIRRDIAERGRSLESVLHQYEKFVKPAFDEFIEPSRKYADLIIPRGGTNTVAINLILEHINRKLQDAQLRNGDAKRCDQCGNIVDSDA